MLLLFYNKIVFVFILIACTVLFCRSPAKYNFIRNETRTKSVFLFRYLFSLNSNTAYIQMDSWSQFRILHLTDVFVYTEHSIRYIYMYVWSSSTKKPHAHFERHQRQHNHQPMKNKTRQTEIESFFTSRNLFRSFYNLYVWLIECGRWLNTCSVPICVCCVYNTKYNAWWQMLHMWIRFWQIDWVSECGKINTHTSTGHSHTRIRIVRIFLTHFNCFLFIYFSR